jgi:hypothetical protein
MAGVTDDYADIFRLEFEKGRFYTLRTSTGANRAIIGATLAESYLEQ